MIPPLAPARFRVGLRVAKMAIQCDHVYMQTKSYRKLASAVISQAIGDAEWVNRRKRLPNEPRKRREVLRYLVECARAKDDAMRFLRSHRRLSLWCGHLGISTDRIVNKFERKWGKLKGV